MEDEEGEFDVLIAGWRRVLYNIVSLTKASGVEGSSRHEAVAMQICRHGYVRLKAYDIPA